MKTKIYGASDDLIEIEGEVTEEASHYDATNVPITCSDGTKAKITYCGEWRIEMVSEGSLFEKLVKCGNDEDPHTDEDCKGCSAYSDVLVMKEGVEWVRIKGKKFKKN